MCNARLMHSTPRRTPLASFLFPFNITTIGSNCVTPLCTHIASGMPGLRLSHPATTFVGSTKLPSGTSWTKTVLGCYITSWSGTRLLMSSSPIQWLPMVPTTSISSMSSWSGMKRVCSGRSTKSSRPLSMSGWRVTPLTHRMHLISVRLASGLTVLPADDVPLQIGVCRSTLPPNFFLPVTMAAAFMGKSPTMPFSSPGIWGWGMSSCSTAASFRRSRVSPPSTLVSPGILMLGMNTTHWRFNFSLLSKTLHSTTCRSEFEHFHLWCFH